MSKKIERLIIAACIGAISAVVLCWVEFYPVLRTEEAIRVPETHPWGDGRCDVQGCNEPRNCFFTETDDPYSAVTEEFCERHERELVSEDGKPVTSQGWIGF